MRSLSNYENVIATQDADRRQILNCLDGEKDLHKEAKTEHPNFTDKFSLPAKLAVVGWQAKMDSGEFFDNLEPA